MNCSLHQWKGGRINFKTQEKQVSGKSRHQLSFLYGFLAFNKEVNCFIYNFYCLLSMWRWNHCMQLQLHEDRWKRHAGDHLARRWHIQREQPFLSELPWSSSGGMPEPFMVSKQQEDPSNCVFITDELVSVC